MRRGRRKVGNRDKVFGCDLQEHLSTTAQEVPQVLRSCSEFIEEYGIVDGIYRLSGVSSNTQKLRSEFDAEGTPDLYKDVYLQDIHCVSSLCKAYFRELPNPLLTYELYDRFADAVAVQLEDERLVKIREVLQDLPAPNHRTLEFLMRHLVKMSTYASQTNMHSRNLAIVWAPNLLRSKDIESTGFNGTAAFMEVRVQSIVVEFILTHVPELFPAPGLAAQRRKSLPSPSILSNQEDQFQFKSLPFNCSGNLSPGDGPPPMRPYHAIIDGTDKRKGSLKGRKWKSIFNLGGRLHDPRKKSKYCPKEKENASLRPAKSMDSLSSGPFAVEDSKHPPPLVLSSGNSEGVAPVGGGVSSGYAVTYRRTGGAQVSMVSGGTPGTYNRLDSVGGACGSEGSSQGMSRSPGMTSKADRRAGIHISGPFSVTVPLHITSGLALGVLHGGWTEKEQTMQEDAEEDQPETEEDEAAGPEVTGAEPERKSAETNDDVKEGGGEVEGQVDCGKTTTEENITLEDEDSASTADAVRADLKEDQGAVTGNVEDLPPQTNEETVDEDYMDMRGHLHHAPPRDIEDFSELPMDVQDAFGFLDLMDSCASNQLEFSVEPPFEEEEDEEEAESPNNPAFSSPVPNLSHDLEMPTANISTSPFTHRPLPGKSFSLPYKSRPFMPALSLSSDEDEYSPDEDDDSDKGSEYEDMFCQSLPSSRDFQGLSWLDAQPAGVTSAGGDVEALSSSQSKCLDETHIILPSKNIEELQSISQSEDMILTATTLTDNSVPSADRSVHEKRLSGDSKTEHLHMEEKNEENKPEDVNDETHTMTGKDGLESTDSDEDTYFGPDPIPSPPEPSSDEPAPVQFPGVEAQQMLETEGYQDNTESEILVTDEVTATDFTPMTAQDEVKTNQPPEEEEKIFHEGKIDEGEEKIREPEEGETEEDEKNILHERNEGEEKIREPEEGEMEEEAKMILHEKKIDEGEEKIREPEEGETKEKEKSEKTVEVGDKILETSQLKTTELEETWRENEESPREEVQEIKECVNNINETVDNGEHEEEHAQNEPVEKVEQEVVEMGNSLDETEIEKESNDKNIEGNEEDMNVNTDGYHESPTREEEGDISCEGITDETEEDKEGISCRDDHEGSTLMQPPNEISCGKLEDGEMEEQGNEESSVSTDEELLHSYGPEEERETATIERASHKASSQVKAVPVVPPKPQNSKLTALTLRKQFQHRDMERQHRHSHFMDTEVEETGPQHRDRCVKPEQQHREQEHGDGDKQNETKKQADETVENCEKQSSETRGDGTSPEDGMKKEREALRESTGTSDAGIELRKDLLREGEREVKRNSGISICFDEAVARATVKRNRESSERLSGAQWERAGKMD